ncbi:MAG: hypothetical protein IPF58_15025 [Saprospirales bacterium]|nr:hypothetical protein [Saprospirales bacterium]
MKKTITLLLILTAIYVFADNPKSNEIKYPFNYGRMEDTIYTNPFFGFKVTVPSTWFVQNKTQIDFAITKGKDIIEFKDEILSKEMEKVDVNSMTLLMVVKYEVGAPVAFNPSLMVMAENVLMLPGVKLGSDYLFHARAALNQSNIKFSCDSTYEKKVISKVDFYKMSCNINESIVKQEYISSILQRYALTFIITYSTEEERNELMAIINSAQFKK